jgi:hypothetical protein
MTKEKAINQLVIAAEASGKYQQFMRDERFLELSTEDQIAVCEAKLAAAKTVHYYRNLAMCDGNYDDARRRAI